MGIVGGDRGWGSWVGGVYSLSVEEVGVGGRIKERMRE